MGGGGGGEEDDGATVETEMVSASGPPGGPPIPLLDGEAILHTEARAKVMRFVPADKSWADAGGVGTLRVVGAGTTRRLVVSQDVGTRERVMLSLGGISSVAAGASPDGTKPGGLTLVAAWAGKDGVAALTKFAVKVKTAGQEAAIAAALGAA